MQTHAVELGDTILRFEWCSMVVFFQVAVNLFGRGKPLVEGANNNHRKLQALRLVNGHDVNMSFRKRLIGVFVLVNSAVVEQSEKAVEEVKTQVLSIAMIDKSVMIVVLKNVQQLRKNREVPGPVLILDESAEWLNGNESIKIIGKRE